MKEIGNLIVSNHGGTYMTFKKMVDTLLYKHNCICTFDVDFTYNNFVIYVDNEVGKTIDILAPVDSYKIRDLNITKQEICTFIKMRERSYKINQLII